VNPRYSVTADAAPYAGADLGWLHYLDMVGESVEPVEWNGRRFHHIVLRRDVNCFHHYLKARLTTWAGIAKSYRSPVFYDFDPRDWRLALKTSIYILKILAHLALRQIVPQKSKPQPVRLTQSQPVAAAVQPLAATASTVRVVQTPNMPVFALQNGRRASAPRAH